MTLDLNQVSGQIDRMVDSLKAGVREKAEHLLFSVDTAKSLDVDAWQAKFKDGKTTWLVAGLESSPSLSYPLPAAPESFSVLGADGSQIEIDRHSPAHCFLLNFGIIRLDYGDRPDAMLGNYPILYSRPEEMSIRDSRGHEQPIEGALLGLKRGVEECRQLALIASQTDHPSLALLDGTLALWGLEAYPEFVTKELLDKGFLKALDDIKKQSQSKELAVASYISYPGANEVVNALRIMLCPYQPVDCDRFCPRTGAASNRKCDSVAGVSDRELFSELLKPGERSAVFSSLSTIMKHYGEHRVKFFYVRVEDEVARVEAPAWVADNNDLLELAHALVFDQCRRGQGYPVALAEAHEQAVVTAADRNLFWGLVEQAMSDQRLTPQVSAKSSSKRTRGV